VKSRNRLALVLCTMVVLAASACAPAATPTVVPEPTHPATPSPVPSPTTLPLVTPTPYPPLETLACPIEYTRYVARDLGFAACYPTGWIITRQEDTENSLTRVNFLAPQGSRGAGLRALSVTTRPAVPGLTDDDFINEINHWLLQEYYDQLLARPRIIDVAGHRAVDAAYRAKVTLGREVVDVTRWVTVLTVGQRRWFVDLVGRTEYRAELEHIRGQFLAHLHILKE